MRKSFKEVKEKEEQICMEYRTWWRKEFLREINRFKMALCSVLCVCVFSFCVSFLWNLVLRGYKMKTIVMSHIFSNLSCVYVVKFLLFCCCVLKRVEFMFRNGFYCYFFVDKCWILYLIFKWSSLPCYKNTNNNNKKI